MVERAEKRQASAVKHQGVKAVAIQIAPDLSVILKIEAKEARETRPRFLGRGQWRTYPGFRRRRFAARFILNDGFLFGMATVGGRLDVARKVDCLASPAGVVSTPTSWASVMP